MKNVWKWEVKRLIQHVLGLTIYSTTDSHWLIRGTGLWTIHTDYELRASGRTYLVKTLLCCKWSNVFQVEQGCQLKSQCNRKESLRRIWKLYSKNGLLLCQSKVFLVSNKIGLVKWAFLVMWGRPPLRETKEGRFDLIPARQRAIAVAVNQNATWWFPSGAGMENSCWACEQIACERRRIFGCHLSKRPVRDQYQSR